MSISPAQCRGARGLLGWSQSDLSEASKTATKTIADFERGARAPYPRTLEDVRRALEKAGIELSQKTGEERACVCAKRNASPANN